MYIYTFFSLTASKEAGASIEIDGKKVALGVPGAQRPVTTKQAPEDYPFIPLRRGGTPEDAASSVLLFVSFFKEKCFWFLIYMFTAWPHLLLRMSPGILWKLRVVLVSRKKRTTYQSFLCLYYTSRWWSRTDLSNSYLAVLYKKKLPIIV